MTVDELIAHLQKLSAEGKGGCDVEQSTGTEAASVRSYLVGSKKDKPVYVVCIEES